MHHLLQHGSATYISSKEALVWLLKHAATLLRKKPACFKVEKQYRYLYATITKQICTSKITTMSRLLGKHILITV